MRSGHLLADGSDGFDEDLVVDLGWEILEARRRLGDLQENQHSAQTNIKNTVECSR